MGKIDLHIHTSASDGTITPRETVELAGKLGLSAIAITDHDTVAGVNDALIAGEELGVKVIPGIEISAGYDDGVHILGLFIDPKSVALRPALDWVIREREARNERIVNAMVSDGIPISIQELQTANPNAVLGRPHIAQWLMNHGYVSSMVEAFDRYLDKGRVYYRSRKRIPLSDAVSCIRNAGGVAVIAHPLQYGYEKTEMETFIRTCVDEGCRAMECIYSGYGTEQREMLVSMAAEYGLAISGGSDFHGKRKPHIQMGWGIDGEISVPDSVSEGLLRVAKNVKI